MEAAGRLEREGMTAEELVTNWQDRGLCGMAGEVTENILRQPVI